MTGTMTFANRALFALETERTALEEERRHKAGRLARMKAHRPLRGCEAIARRAIARYEKEIAELGRADRTDRRESGGIAVNTNIIAAHEGQTVHNSMIDALVAQEIRRQNDARLAEALAAWKQAEDDAELMRAAYRAHWQEKIDDAVELYSWNPTPGPAARLLLGLWALVWWIIGREYRRLSAWNRS